MVWIMHLNRCLWFSLLREHEPLAPLTPEVSRALPPDPAPGRIDAPNFMTSDADETVVSAGHRKALGRGLARAGIC